MDPVVVLDATMTVSAARSVLSLAGPKDRFVVRRRDPRVNGALLWYPLSTEGLERITAPNVDPAMTLKDSLELHEHLAQPVRQLGHPDVVGGHWTGLVVDGARAVGWTNANPSNDRGPTRGLDFGPGGGLVATERPGTGFAPDESADAGGDRVVRQFDPTPPRAESAPAESEPEAPGDVGDAVGPPVGSTGSDVAAYPRVDVPETVAPASTFEVVVGLAKQAQRGVEPGAQMLIPGTVDELTVQVKAENFALANVRFRLPFDRTDVTAHTITIAVTAPPVTEPWRGRIEIEYAHDGLLVGSAWRDVVVTPQAPDEAPPSTSGGEVAMGLDQTVPIDLTVSISRGQADGTFLWTFTTAHPVTLPDEQVITTLDADTAETFALRKIREMARVDGSGAAELKVTGVAREVAAVMPLWFWKVLAQVWRIAADSGRLPTLLLVSQESLVPWELATTDADYIVDRTLVDEAAPQVLGAQTIMGRWRPAGPETPSGVRRPTTTPAEAIAIRGLAVVVGEFGPSSGFRSLKEAIAEGQHLTQAYQAVWVKGTVSEVSTLLKGQYTHQGVPLDAQVLHVASHGEVDPDSPINSGLILSDSAVRIDESIVAGSEFTRSAAPLVFLNACQLGTDTGGALVEGGLAAAFLQAGARAFVAPLWSVDDTIAKDTAVQFYKETMVNRRPVGEVMRELRARFTTAFPQRDQTTPLAYAYYGHPGLTLTQ